MPNTRNIEDGWCLGAPKHIDESIVEMDFAAYKRYPCALCGHCRPNLEAQHRGREYRLVATCRDCGHEEII